MRVAQQRNDAFSDRKQPGTLARMTLLESGLYLRVQELENGPKPLPLHSGFSRNAPIVP